MFTPEESWRHNRQMKAEIELESLGLGRCLSNPRCVCPAEYVNRKDQTCICPCHGTGEDLI